MSVTKVLGNDHLVLRGKRMLIVATRAAPGVIIATHIGFDDGEVLDRYLEMVGQEIEMAGSIALFIDAGEQSGLAGDARDRAANWMKSAAKGATVSSDLLIKSKLLEMAMSILTMLTGNSKNMKYHSDARSYEKALARKGPFLDRLAEHRAFVKTQRGA
jgi:hypothetical protein